MKFKVGQTLEDKLKLFKAGTHVLYTPTREIYDKLMVELEKRGYVWCDGKELPTKYNGYSSKPYVTKSFVCEHNGIARQSKAYDKEVITLTPEDFSSSKQGVYMKITIETDGHHKTTAECNGITAESLCNPADEFDLPKGVHMAVQRLLEKLEEPDEDTGFHVGDIVEVVANEAGFRGNPIGLQGVVKEIIADGAGVKLPIRKRPLYFYNRELKLIRRGNN